MPGSVLMCARPLPYPHWHTSTSSNFPARVTTNAVVIPDSTSPRGTNPDLATEAPCSRLTTLAVPECRGTVCDYGTNRSPTLGFIPLECLPHGVCDRHATVTISSPRGLS